MNIHVQKIAFSVQTPNDVYKKFGFLYTSQENVYKIGFSEHVAL